MYIYIYIELLRYHISYLYIHHIIYIYICIFISSIYAYIQDIYIYDIYIWYIYMLSKWLYIYIYMRPQLSPQSFGSTGPPTIWGRLMDELHGEQMQRIDEIEAPRAGGFWSSGAMGVIRWPMNVNYLLWWMVSG
jgi:hypothetical protein